MSEKTLKTIGLFEIGLSRERSDQVEAKVKEWANRPIDFSFEVSGTHLYSMCELRNSYARRYVDIANSIKKLLEHGHIIPAAILGRALIETIGMGCLYLHDLYRLIKAGNIDKLDAKFRKYYMGFKGKEIEPVHVMDGVRHLEKVDNKYGQYLDQKYGLLSKIFEELNGVHDLEHKNFSDLLSVMKTYDELSEISHPNGLGTQYLYPEEENETASVDRVRSAFRVSALRPIWQGHHLIKACEDTEDFPELYRDVYILQRPID